MKLHLSRTDPENLLYSRVKLILKTKRRNDWEKTGETENFEIVEHIFERSGGLCGCLRGVWVCVVGELGVGGN